MTDDDALLMEAIAASLLSSKTAGVHESQLQTALAASRLEAGHQKEDSELDQAIAKSIETFQAEKTARLARLAEEAATEAARRARLTRMSARFKTGLSIQPTVGLLAGISPEQPQQSQSQQQQKPPPAAPSAALTPAPVPPTPAAPPAPTPGSTPAPTPTPTPTPDSDSCDDDPCAKALITHPPPC